MFVYFDKNGVVKEVINDESIRQGNIGVNKIYFFWEDAETASITTLTARYRITRQPGEERYPPVTIDRNVSTTTESAKIPFNPKRDLKFFKYFKEYDFFVATIPSEVLAQAGDIGLSIRVIFDNNTDLTLGYLCFSVEESAEGNFEVANDGYLGLAEYQYLRNLVEFNLSPVTSVNLKTGDVVLNATDIKLTTTGTTVQANFIRVDEEINRVEGEIPDTSNFVTTTGNQTIYGIKTFTSDIKLLYTTQAFVLGNPDTVGTSYTHLGIRVKKANEDSHVLTLPYKTGTLATTDDIPSNYVTTDTSQSITGFKTFLNANGIEIKRASDNRNTVILPTGVITHDTFTQQGLDDPIIHHHSAVLPAKDGTIALTSDIQKFYKHTIRASTYGAFLYFINSDNTPCESYDDVVDIFSSEDKSKFVRRSNCLHFYQADKYYARIILFDDVLEDAISSDQAGTFVSDTVTEIQGGKICFIIKQQVVKVT